MHIELRAAAGGEECEGKEETGLLRSEGDGGNGEQRAEDEEEKGSGLKAVLITRLPETTPQTEKAGEAHQKLAMPETEDPTQHL